MNEIDVFSASTETETAAIPVPTPMGIDISPVDGSLWAGTVLGDVYKIDTAKLSVIARYPADGFGPKGFSASAALVLADGRLALQNGLISGGGLIVWNPQTNDVDAGNPIYGSLCPYGNSIVALDGTRKLILAAAAVEAASIPLCSYNTVTRVETDGSYTSSPDGGFLRQIVSSPDGSKFFVTTDVDGVQVFNPQTLQPIAQIAPTASTEAVLPSAAAGGVMSLDGKTLYLVDEETCAILGYDASTYQQVIKAPHPAVNSSFGCMTAAAIDPSRLILGPMDHGIGFADGSVNQDASSANTARLTAAVDASGPVSGGAEITGGLSVGSSLPFSLSQFYVGNSPDSGATLNANGTFSATAPPARTGMAADLMAIGADGTVAVAPEGYSYGPTILEVAPNAATADGGQLGAIIGYGFGSSASDVQVTIGGQAATVQKVFTSAPIEPYPFWTEGVTFIIPPGAAGKTDITVTTSSGSASGTFTYTPASVSYASSTTLQEGIYDSHRDLYFFSDKSQIQVLSPSGTWQTPISLPGTTSSSQLLAISESPNGSLLAVADFGGGAIFVLNPDLPANVKRYPIPGTSIGPVGLAVLDNGDVYFSTGLNTGSNPGGAATFNKFSTSTGQFKSFFGNVSGSPYSPYIRVLLSPDQSKVYCEATPFWIDTATDTVNTSYTLFNVGLGTVDGAVSADGSTVFVSGILTDALMNAENAPSYIDWETWLPLAVYGQKLNSDGSILYQPLSNGVDLIERNTGRLLYRAVIPGTVAGVYDSMFLGASPATLGFITPTGVTLTDLSSLPIPFSALKPFPAARSAAANNANPSHHPDFSRPTAKIKQFAHPLKHLGTMSGAAHY